MSSVLPQAAGYGVVIGMGLFFSVVMIGVPPGLIAAGIVSAWTWAATLLQSSATAYKFGISGPWWYASGATIQILLFAMIASKLKQNAPNCHTYLEIMRVRWGKLAHLTFLFFGLATNVIVSTMLILGGSATVTDLTGMNTIAACFLIPLGVCIYVLAGGMRATLIADWSHTLVLYCILIAFALKVYATSDTLGSPAMVWQRLQEAAVNQPIEGNAGGSYLTMRSKSGLIFGVMNIVGNFGTVFADQAYFQRAIASSPRTSVKAFLLGGLAWFGIPMGIATSMGLAAVALARGDNPIISLTPSEVSAGLPAVKALMGQSGAVAMLILLFLAVTSACSAEQIAVSSLFAYDVYGVYINPKATDKQLLWTGRAAIVGCAIMMGVFATVFHYIGVSMGYLYELMGTMIGSAVVPIACCITWRRANGHGAVAGAILGFIAGVAGWIGLTAKLNGGVVNVDTTFGDYEMLTGNLLAIGVGGIVTVVWSLVSPSDFDWETTRAINSKAHSAASMVEEVEGESPGVEGVDSPGVKEGKGQEGFPSLAATEATTEAAATEDTERVDMNAEERADLQKAFRFAMWSALILVFVLIFAIPLPLFFSSYVYPVKGFAAWVTISIIWLFTGLMLVGVYPVWEAREGLSHIWAGIRADIKGKRA